MNAIHANHSYGSSAFIHTRDGRKLHYMSKGDGHPIVVFESGMGFSRSAWGLVAPQVAEHTQSVVYDRSGLGRSEVDTEQRTLRRLTEDLSDLLTALGPGPFILVGHSWGGPVVRAAAAADLSRIRGLILVDPSDENCDLYFSALAKTSFAVNRWLLPWMARTGLYRKMGSKPGQVQPEDVARDHREEDFTVQAARTMAAESVAFLDDLASMRNTPLSWEIWKSGLFLAPRQDRESIKLDLPLCRLTARQPKSSQTDIGSKQVNRDIWSPLPTRRLLLMKFCGWQIVEALAQA